MVRMERSEWHFIEALAENSAEVARAGKENSAALSELRDDIRANTRAVLSVLDRRDGPEGGAA